MSAFSILVDAFEIYKNDPISVNSFEIIGEKLEKLFESTQGLEELFAISEDSAGSYCGISFKKDQLMYHCR